MVIRNKDGRKRIRQCKNAIPHLKKEKQRKVLKNIKDKECNYCTKKIITERWKKFYEHLLKGGQRELQKKTKKMDTT